MEKVVESILAAREGVDRLEAEIRRCTICRDHSIGPPLPREPHPILALSSSARVCIAGQAPGNLADLSGRPFTDPSGIRLRNWLGIGEDVFYDRTRIAIVPMGFCFPGTAGPKGDLPPRRECRQNWHSAVFDRMPQIEVILAVGHHAQQWHLKRRGSCFTGRPLSRIVEAWRAVLEETRDGPAVWPLPHPSWRNTGWILRNPWFEETLLPHLRRRIAELL